MKTKINSRWQTVATVGFTRPVSRDEVRQAHGGVCHLQVRLSRDGRLLGRRVNSNGRAVEIGPSEPIDDTTYQHWLRIGASR